MNLQDFLYKWIAEETVSTEDVLSSFLPLVRSVIDTHRAGFVAPLEGLQNLSVEGNRVWFESARRQPQRQNTGEVARLERTAWTPIEVLAESRRVNKVSEAEEELSRLDVGERGAPVTRPVYLPGYVGWEHEIQHHDPLTDIFSLGLLLASLACQLNMTEPADLQAFVTNRRNLFSLNPKLHPVLGQAIFRMTELDRHRRAQDLPALLHNLENYRDQTIPLDLDLARTPGFRSRNAGTRQEIVLGKLRDRLFDLSRRNTLLHFRPTMQSMNLTQASIPLMLDVRNIRPDQVLVWNEGLRGRIAEGKSVSLNKHLNFSEAVYLPLLLERLIADARRDQHEFGFVQLRLVVCFLTWSNLKEKPIEQFVSPLALVPVRLSKTKGIRDTYALEPLSQEAEVNPVLRHQFKQLYNIDLPASVDLAATRLESLFELLSAKIQASEPAVTLNLIDRPRIDLIHETARRRLDQYRRGARVSGRGVRHFGKLDYSYDPANYHPLGIKLFSSRVRMPGSHLRDLIEERPRPRSFFAAEPNSPVIEAEKSFFQLRDSVEANPYLWSFDLCNLTLANFRYRRMSLVRDYETILQSTIANPAFEATFSFEPRSVERELTATPALEDRFDVVPSDPTQALAIAEARGDQSYIIQGPPGTGKSQTITNLIADHVARGKRVLFVCEKRAAIDVVFSRLRQAGLGGLCSLIHDSQTDKKEFILDLKQSYEQFLDDSRGKPRKRAPRAAALKRMRDDLAPLESFEAAMAAELAESNLTLRQFLDRAIEIDDRCPPLSPEAAEQLPHYSKWHSNAERLAALEPAIRDLEPSGILARHPLHLLAPSLRHCDRPIELVSSTTQTALLQLHRLVQSQATSGIPPDQSNTIGRARILVDYMKHASPLVQHGNMELIDPASERSMQFAAAINKIREAQQALEMARRSTTAWREKLSPADLPTALEQARSWQDRSFTWISVAWWQLRSVLHRRYDFKAHAVRPSWVQILTALEHEYKAVAAVDQAIRSVQATFHIATFPDDFQQQVGDLRDTLNSAPEWLRGIHAELVKSSGAELIVQRTLAADEPLSGLTDGLATILIDFDKLSFESLQRELNAVSQFARQAPQLLRLLGEIEQLPASIAAAVRRTEWTLPQLEAAVARTTWERLLLEDRRLAQFEERDRSRCALRLQTAYDRWLAANAEEIFNSVRKRFLDHVRTSNLVGS